MDDKIERLIKAKIPCQETGIEVRKTICDICSPGFHCGIDAYVKDGKVIKIEGDKNHPVNAGLLCTKGLNNRRYIYRDDRILTPLRRTGRRGEGSFEPITWEEAYKEIGERLNIIKETDGADSVAFFSGYGKWYRPMLQRFAFSFGSPNYGTESSACYTSGLMAWEVATGCPAKPAMPSTDLFLGWAFNGYYSRYNAPAKVQALKDKGVRVIIVDPKITPAVLKLADLHLRPRLGTDGALALAIANELISHSWIDTEYIDKYVYGFEEYKAYAARFNESNVEELTGVPYGHVVKAAEMIHESKSMCINESSAPLGHHKNGMQNYRAIMSLLAITGNYDKKGGQLPAPHTYTHVSSGFLTKEEEFIDEVRPLVKRPVIGSDRFPLWFELERQMQSMDLSRQIREGTPYPVKAVFALGMNYRMFAASGLLYEALKTLDFFVDVDLFMTDTAKLADIVLPACSSFERGEFKCYPMGYAYYTKPAIQPLGQAKSDVDILSELARSMNLGDELLESGYENCVKYIIQNLNITVEELKASDTPLLVPDFKPHKPGSAIENRLHTLTGKFELKSALIESHPEWGLDALPTYRPPNENGDRKEYPFTLCTGARIPNAIHSRLHDVEWGRSLRPKPTAEISRADAQARGIEEGNLIDLITPDGRITVNVLITDMIKSGEVFFYHGYREADANLLVGKDSLDSYSGFPAFRSIACDIRKR